MAQQDIQDSKEEKKQESMTEHESQGITRFEFAKIVGLTNEQDTEQRYTFSMCNILTFGAITQR